jgi:hypothetical protein
LQFEINLKCIVVPASKYKPTDIHGVMEAKLHTFLTLAKVKRYVVNYISVLLSPYGKELPVPTQQADG